MSKLLSEKCSACMEGMVFNKERLTFSERICCQKPCEVFEERSKAYNDGISHMNPCFFCSKFEHCSEQLKNGFYS